jgi:HEAT repeat protein
MSGFRPAEASRPVAQGLLLSAYVADLTPGSYRLHAETTAHARDGAAAPWRELPLAVELAVEVTADDDAALGAVFDALGTRAQGAGDDGREAVRQLESVRDPRVIPLWVRLAQVPRYEPRYQALHALGTYDDARALAALVRAVDTRPEELDAAGYTNDALRAESAAALRNTAAQALAESPRAGAVDALLAQQGSADDQVRLTVLHRAARLPAAQARPYLERALHDSYPLVRSEAQRYLREQRP